ncbi:unnamed protein product [Schistosoma turkestanicum]|nr:unnamed protein product [Schistosoma turkestanicum]
MKLISACSFFLTHLNKPTFKKYFLLNPVPDCLQCVTNLPPMNNDYFVQTPFVLPPKFQENSQICLSADIYSKTPKSPRLALNNLNVQCSTSSELYSWCPVSPQVDGDCCLAGIERRPNQTSCRFVVTNRVSCVSENGQSVYTEGSSNIYYLRGGFSWSTFCALHPMLSINSPPPGMIDAFSNGFPAHNWRSWTQGLHYFITTTLEGIKEPIVINSGVKPVNVPNSIDTNKPLKQNQYKHILNSINRDVDLDSFVVNTFRNLENDLETTDPTSKTNDDDVPSNDKSAPPTRSNDNDGDDANNNVSVASSFSHFTSISNVPFVMNMSKKSRQRKVPKKNQSNGDRHHHHHTNAALKKSIKKNQYLAMEKRTNLHRIKKSTYSLHNKHQLPPNGLLLNRQSIVKDKNTTNNNNDNSSSIDERYRLYTASGKVIDVRELNRTRSGRIVLPKLDSRYEQSVVLNHGHIMGVSRNADDETLVSWISESSSSQ